LHIEVLNERIEDFEKEKEELRKTLANDQKEHEKKLKDKMHDILDQK
jgi:hypothetical protein